jgi:hypothetical protein
VPSSLGARPKTQSDTTTTMTMETGWREIGWRSDGDRMEIGWRSDGDRMEIGYCHSSVSLLTRPRRAMASSQLTTRLPLRVETRVEVDAQHERAAVEQRLERGVWHAWAHTLEAQARLAQQH